MSRGRRIALGAALALAVLLAINTLVVGNETKSAEVTIEGGQILTLPAGDVQVVDEGPAPPASKPGVVPRQPASATIVLLHCYACSLHWWDRLAPILARDHRVIRIDLLGFGGSEKPSGGYTIEEQAATVAAALDRLEVQGAVVVGHSMGFGVATALAESSSQLVDRLVNIDEGPTSDSCSTPFTAKFAYLPVLGQAMWRTVPDFLVKNAYSAAVAPDYELEDGFPDPDQVLADRDGMTFTSYSDASDGASEYADEIALHDRLRPLAIPLLSIFGSEDEVCDPEESQEAYATVPAARVAEIEGAGHSPNIEAPRETAALIEEFAADAGDDTIPPPPEDIGRNEKPPGAAGPGDGRPVVEEREGTPDREGSDRGRDHREGSGNGGASGGPDRLEGSGSEGSGNEDSARGGESRLGPERAE